MRAIQINEYGGPEVLTLVELPDPVPGEGELLLDVTAAGVNYADTHRTEGSYLTGTELPHIPGSEVVGQTADGRRVLAFAESGGYADKAVVPAAYAVPIPDGVGDGEALALLVQGLSAWHLLRTSAQLKPGESVVVNAAAGGVGSLAVQLARLWGAGRIIAAASSPDKRELALKLGADVAVDNAPDGYAERVIEANGGKKVHVLLDAIGGRVFGEAVGAVAPWGRLVTFGAASREQATPLDPTLLVRRNLAVVGFWLAPALSRPEMIGPPLAELLSLTAQGKLHPVVGGEYPLAEARRAHEDLLSRRTTGKLILRPQR